MKLYEAIIDGGSSVRYVVFEHNGGLRSAYAAAKTLLRDDEVLRGIIPLEDESEIDTDEVRTTHEVVTV